MEANEQSVIDQLRVADGSRPIAPVEPAAPAAVEQPVEPPTVETPAAPTETPQAQAPVEEKPAAPAAPQSAVAAPNLEELQQKLAGYQAKEQVSPFANDLVKQINDMVASGASLEEMEQYLSIQKLDVNAMDDEAAIKTSLKLQNPALTDKHIDALYREKYYIDEDEDENAVALVDAKRKMAALGARAELAQKKVDSVPATVRQAQLEQVRIETAKQAWAGVVSQVGQQIDLSVKADGVDVPFKYSVPEDVLAAGRQEAVEWAAKNKIPATTEGLKQIEKFLELHVWASKGAEIKENLVRNTWEHAERKIRAELSGAPAATPSAEPVEKQTAEQAAIASIRAIDGL